MCSFVFFNFANILFQQGLSISFPCKGTITNADSSVLGRKKARRFSILVLWIGCNRSIRCWWTYWNCGHAAQCHFPGRRLQETSPGASWTLRSEESEDILVVFYNICCSHVNYGLQHPYLHHSSDELGQHGQGESEDVEKRNGSEGFLCS